MINVFMRFWCYMWGHGKGRYTVHQGNVILYCRRCKRTIALDKRGSWME